MPRGLIVVFLGLGEDEELSKRVVLANLPSVSLLLWKIKHLLAIKPVTFPNSFPDDFDPERDGSKLSLR
jgi:hypothetical protein